MDVARLAARWSPTAGFRHAIDQIVRGPHGGVSILDFVPRPFDAALSISGFREVRKIRWLIVVNEVLWLAALNDAIEERIGVTERDEDRRCTEGDRLGPPFGQEQGPNRIADFVLSADLETVKLYAINAGDRWRS